MVWRKRKKVRKMRGSKTHGWGAMKKHRGSGNRGGKGRAGSGKRADSKKPRYWSEPLPKGFVSIKKLKLLSKQNCINIEDVVKKFPKEKNIDLTEKGYDKLLGKGRISKGIEIKVRNASKIAIEKIESAGGKVLLQSSKEEERTD